MKIEKLEAHDRLIHLHKDQALNVAQGAEDCLKKNDLSLRLQQHSPYIYLFAHPRTIDVDERMKMFLTGKYETFEKTPSKKMVWQPRLRKPKAQTNSFLFRAVSNADQIETCWLIPPRETWSQYEKGKVTENELVLWSIAQFQFHRDDLEKSCPDDLTEDQIKNIYLIIGRDMDEEKRMKKIYDPI